MLKLNFKPGTKINKKYQIKEFIGAGYEGEVYIAKEKNTGIELAIKFFYPGKDLNTLYHAKKLHKLRDCKVLIKYNTQDSFDYEGKKINYLVSEYVEGEILSNFVKQQKGKKLHYYAALHLIYALAKGIKEIHDKKEYHGDLHSDNIIITSFGLKFGVKILDMYKWDCGSRENKQDDIIDLMKLFYEIIGGKETYSKLPEEIKEIICGKRKKQILKNYNNINKLIHKIEEIQIE